MGLTLAEQLEQNNKSRLMRVEIYNPPSSDEETVIQEEESDPTPE